MDAAAAASFAGRLTQLIAKILPKLVKAGILKTTEMPGRLLALFGADVANPDFVIVP